MSILKLHLIIKMRIKLKEQQQKCIHLFEQYYKLYKDELRASNRTHCWPEFDKTFCWEPIKPAKTSQVECPWDMCQQCQGFEGKRNIYVKEFTVWINSMTTKCWFNSFHIKFDVRFTCIIDKPVQVNFSFEVHFPTLVH